MALMPAASRPRIGDMLGAAGLVSPLQLEAALLAQRTRRKRLGEILREDGIIDDLTLSAVLSVQLDTPLVDLRHRPSEDEALRVLAEADARRLCVLPLAIDAGGLQLAVDDPDDEALLSEAASLTGYAIEPLLAPRSGILDAIGQRYRVTGNLQAQVTAFAGSQSPATTLQGRVRALVSEGIDEAPVVQIVNLLVAQALRDRASDLHIEPQARGIRIRARIDGILRDVAELPAEMGASLASRIKIMSQLNIVEKQRAQDGQISLEIDGREVDIRVATMRTIWGEKVVLRLLDKSRNVLQLAELGVPPDMLPAYRTLLHAPFGMLIVSGPTGSGKTTTLYASMQELDRGALNVTTVEDPVEYTLENVNQTQVNAAPGVTFAAGLRAILRQDPDVILIGETRDRETAEIAVQASLTGHLVLTSMHATDATGALLRLVEMGIEPFLISASVSGVVAQRLMRRVCPHCRIEIESSGEERALYEAAGLEPPAQTYLGRGCMYCGQTGYLDRTGIYELLRITPELRRLVSRSADYDRVHAQATADGMVPMRRVALAKAAAGVTTVGEALRSVAS
jgi:type IV pilus assembly protein PilB